MVNHCVCCHSDGSMAVHDHCEEIELPKEAELAMRLNDLKRDLKWYTDKYQNETPDFIKKSIRLLEVDIETKENGGKMGVCDVCDKKFDENPLAANCNNGNCKGGNDG